MSQYHRQAPLKERNLRGARPPSSLPISVPLIVLILLAGIGLWTSYYTIPAESEGVVLRFGKYIDKVPPGLHFKLPFGIDAVIAVPIQRQLKQEFGFATPDATHPDQVGAEPAKEQSMVTGDLNSVLVEWIVQYRITDSEKYWFAVREPGQTLRDISESVMREAVGDRTVDEVITVGRQDIETTALNRMREMAERYHLGVSVDQVQLKNVNPPEPVQASFNEVNRAQQDRENFINVANGEYNKAVPRVRGEADQKIRAAEGLLERIHQRMISERLQIVQRFRSEGAGEAARISGKKERDINEIVSTAYKRVQEIRGEADAKATEIYAKAYTQRPEAADFYRFLKSMATYRKVITNDATIVLSTNSDLFALLRRIEPKSRD